MVARPFRKHRRTGAQSQPSISRALRLLADADAMRSLGSRPATGAVGGPPYAGQYSPPVFEAADARELGQEPDANLPAMTKGEHVVTDYQSIRLSLKGHPMEFLRD